MKKKAHRLMVITIIVGLIFGVSSAVSASGINQPAAQANVYYVSTTGSDSNPGTSTAPFQTFKKADSVLAPGDVLQVMPGTYYEPLVIRKSGTATAPITVVGNGAILNMQGIVQTGMKIRGSFVNVSGFEVTGATDAGIAIPGQNVTVSYNNVHDNVTENGIGAICGVAASHASALKVGVGGQNIIIEGNAVHNNCGEGIAVTRGVNVVVRNNTVYDNFSPSIYVDNSPYTTVQGNNVYCTGAVLRRDGRRPTGIGLGEEYYDGWGAQLHDVVISGNTVTGCGKGIATFASEVGGALTNVTITGNYIPNGEQRPIALSSSPNFNVVISYNTIYTDPYISDPVGVIWEGNVVGVPQ